MIQKNGLKQLGLFSLIVLAITVSSCQRPDVTEGLDLIPTDDLLSANQTDTFNIVAVTEIEDSLISSEVTLNMLGSMIDPVFGITRAGFVTQVLPSTSTVDFPSNFEVDSVVLALVYDEDMPFYGRLIDQSFAVHELNEGIDLDNDYYTNYTPSFHPGSLMHPDEVKSKVVPYENAVVGGDTLVPQLRLKLDNALAQQLMVPTQSGVYDSNDTFLEYFKGLYVEAQPHDAAILFFDLVDVASKLTIYYRDLDGVEADTTNYDFLINSSTARVTVTEHLYTQAPLNSLTLDNQLDGSSLCYLQSASGLKTRLDLSSILELPVEELITINRAELIIPFTPDYKFGPPEKIVSYFRDEDGNLQVLPDAVIQGIGGSVNTSDHEYRIVMTQFIQDYLNGDIVVEGLYLLASAPSQTAERVVLHGPDFSATDKSENMRLVLTFSK